MPGTLELFRNHVSTLSGGTRTAVKLSRPWQYNIATIAGNECPFETKPQNELDRMETTEGVWRVLDNTATPYAWHRLLIPEKCWEEKNLRTLGGSRQIANVLTLAGQTMKKESMTDRACLGIHVGWHAGQNVWHPHYHLIKPYESEEAGDFHRLNSCTEATEIIRTGNFSIFCGGYMTGQCQITPTDKDRKKFCEQSTEEHMEIGTAVARLISMFNKSFTSTQGMPPDFRLGFQMENGFLMRGVYTPILNQLGFDADIAAVERTPYVLAWTHESTADHLHKGQE